MQYRKRAFFFCVNLTVCVECSNAHPCEGLSDHAHFRNFGMAFLTLFRVATGDNWNGIMKVRSASIAAVKSAVG